MAPLELRAIAYAVVSLVLIGLGVAIGAFHVQAKWNIDKLNQDKALQSQQAEVIRVTQERDALQIKVGESHVQILASGSALVGGVSDRLLALESAIRSGALRPSVVNTGGVQNALAGSGIPSELAAGIGRLNAAITSLAAECVHVDADRSAILSLEPKQPEPKK
jgi:hypothetical protein